MKEKGKKEEG